MLHLDAGGFSNFFIQGGTGATRAVLSCYEKFALAAINVTARELADDGSRFIKLAKEFDLPFVASNLVYQDSGETLFPGSLTLKFAGETYGIMGVTKHLDIEWTDEEGRVVVTRNVKEALIEGLAALKGKVDHTILLAFVPKRELKEILSGLEGFDIALGTDGFSTTEEPELVNQTTVFYSGTQGKYHGEFQINTAGNKLVNENSFDLVFLPRDYPEDEEVKALINSFRVVKAAEK